jgi:hypothetical protein
LVLRRLTPGFDDLPHQLEDVTSRQAEQLSERMVEAALAHLPITEPDDPTLLQVVHLQCLATEHE